MTKRPLGVHVLAGLLALQGLSGLAGGFGLTFDPSGESVQLPLEWLEGSPFTDYLIPGIVLLTVLGVGPLVAAYGVWAWKPWSWAAALLVGLALIVWIGIEILVVGYQARPPLQLIYGSVGAAILGLVLTPAVRGFLSVDPQ